MKFILRFAAALLIAAPPVLAQQPHEPFPDDYKVAPCAPETGCETFPDSKMPSAAARFLGYELEVNWIAAHSSEMRKAIAPYCKKLATCLATRDNLYAFCDDIVSAEARPLCEKMFPAAKNMEDNLQCREYFETYFLGVDQQAIRIWEKTQKCAKEQPAVTHTKPPIVWMVPDVVPLHFKGTVQFFALDPDTHVPLYSNIVIEDQIIYAPANPAGNSATYYPFNIPFKYSRIKNADGHTDAVPPLLTIQTPGYPDVTFRLAAKVPTVHLEMTPGVPSLHAGENSVTVTAKEVENGKPIDGRVMVGDDLAGYSNTPITLTLPQGKRPEIWFKPFLDSYSDVVIAPAEK